MPKINDYKANMDAAIYIYRCMYNDYSIHNCTIPTTSFKLQGVLRRSKKIATVIIVVLDLGGLRIKKVLLVFIVQLW